MKNEDREIRSGVDNWAGQLTLRELLEMTADTGGAKLPTARKLRASGEELLISIEVENSRLTVYRNGFFTYSNGSFVTVQSISLCRRAFEYKYQDGTVVTHDYQVFANQPFAIRLTLEGEKRLAQNQVARNKKHVYSYDNMAEESSNLIDRSDFAAAFVEHEELKALFQLIRQALTTLTAKQKEVVKRYFFENETQQQIADALGCKKQSVNECLQGALKKIRKVTASLSEDSDN